MTEGAASPASAGVRTRREFLALAGSLGALGALDALGVWYLKGVLESAIVPTVPSPMNAGPRPAWETAPGVVDYSRVPADLSGPTPGVLKVAQWYDYWPGSFLSDFVAYVQQTYNRVVSVQVDTYTSNAELYSWLLAGRRYDVIFPTSHMVGLLDSFGGVYNMNLDWIPNVANLDPTFRNTPAGAPYDRRSNGSTVALPYFWGTTGLAWRTDKIPLADVEAQGMDFLWMDSFTPSDPSYPTVTLKGQMQMVGEERDVVAWGLKKAGWEAQKAQGLTPTGLVPAQGGIQWTSNETDPGRVGAAGDWLRKALPNLASLGAGPGDFNSTQSTTSLLGGTKILNQGWSGDVTFATRPDQTFLAPVGYLIPVQGSCWWIDTITLPSTARNLWLAHQFANFIHSVTAPWPENILLTKWNLYPTPNMATYDILAQTPFPNGWNMALDPILYPNRNAPDQWKLVDLMTAVPADVLINEYNPLWYSLTSA